MANEVYCDNCGEAINGDGPLIYDEKCYTELEGKIEDLENDKTILQGEVDELTDKLNALEEEEK